MSISNSNRFLFILIQSSELASQHEIFQNILQNIKNQAKVLQCRCWEVTLPWQKTPNIQKSCSSPSSLVILHTRQCKSVNSKFFSPIQHQHLCMMFKNCEYVWLDFKLLHHPNSGGVGGGGDWMAILIPATASYHVRMSWFYLESTDVSERKAFIVCHNSSKSLAVRIYGTDCRQVIVGIKNYQQALVHTCEFFE